MEIKISELVHEVNDTMEKVVNTFSEIAEDHINSQPFENSWTAAQVMKHLVLSNGGFAEIMRGAVSDSERDPAENIEKIKSIFLDFSIKLKSPDFIVPPDKIYNKAALLKAFTQIRDQLVNIIETQDLSKLCTAFKLPQLGYLTRLEAVHFVVYHTQRHTHQLKNLREAIQVPDQLAKYH